MTQEEATSESTRYEGLGFGFGFALGATACWVLPYLLGVGQGWTVAGEVAAWILFTVAATGSLIEVENVSDRHGFSELGIAALVASVGAGLLALAVRVLSGGILAGVAAVLGALLIVFGCVVVGMGIGKIASGRPTIRNRGSKGPGVNDSRQAAGISGVEIITVALAAAQVILGGIALLRP